MGKCAVLWNKAHHSTRAADIIKDKLNVCLVVPNLQDGTHSAMQ